MRFGGHLRELWRLKRGVAAAIALALVAALWSVDRISVFPPGIKSRPITMAAAHTRVLVDSPRSAVVDVRANTYDFASITNRALLIGNVMASSPVRAYIGRRADLNPDRIQVTSPLTPDLPRPLAATGTQRHTSDLLKSPDQYRLNIQVNPTVPVVDITTQAPSTQAARVLANAAVDGMRDYLRTTADAQATPVGDRVLLTQLGRASGGVVNGGAGAQLAILSFLLVLGASCAVVLFAARVRRGWALESEREMPPGARA